MRIWGARLMCKNSWCPHSALRNTGLSFLSGVTIFVLILFTFIVTRYSCAQYLHWVSNRRLAYLTKSFLLPLTFLACYISVFLRRGIWKCIHLPWVFRLIQIYFLLHFICIIRCNCFRRRISAIGHRNWGIWRQTSAIKSTIFIMIAPLKYGPI
jgi:hypothetical protein